MSVPDWWAKPRKIAIVVDNESWILLYAQNLADWCTSQGDEAVLLRRYDDIPAGTAVAFFLGCTGIAGADILQKSQRNLLVHESDLPQGRGFAPMTWQIIEGKSHIPVCLLEAGKDADSGPIIYRDEIALKGTEIWDEWRALQGKKTIELCQKFLNEKAPPQGQAQSGEGSSHARRRARDSQLDPNKTIADQFDLMRTVHNEDYPAFFEHRGQRYILKIYKDKR